MTPRLEVDETTIVFAFRYALGRRSTAPSHVIAVLWQHWMAFAPYTQHQIQREIAIAIARGDGGDQCDMDAWREVLTWGVKDDEDGYVSTDGNAHA